MPQASTTTLVVGVAALVILFTLKIYAPRVPGALVTLALGRSPGSDIFHSLSQFPDSETYPGLVILRFDGPLYFATANALREKVREVTMGAAPPVTKVLIDMEGVNYIDIEGADMLNEIASHIKGAGVEIHLARVKHEVMEMLKKDGLDQAIGRDHIHGKVLEAVKWLTRRQHPEAQNGQ